MSEKIQKIDPRKAREAIELLKAMGVPVQVPPSIEGDRKVFEQAKARIAELEKQLEIARQEAQAKAATLYGFGLLSEEDVNKFVLLPKARAGGVRGPREGSKKMALWDWAKSVGEFTRGEAMEQYRALGGASSGALGVYLQEWVTTGALEYDRTTGRFRVTGKPT